MLYFTTVALFVYKTGGYYIIRAELNFYDNKTFKLSKLLMSIRGLSQNGTG